MSGQGLRKVNRSKSQDMVESRYNPRPRDHNVISINRVDCNDLPAYGNNIFRPIQYLGSKIRSLQKIVHVIQKEVGPSGHVLDIFSGTTVVGQALALAGFKVTTTDAMAYSSVFGEALLGVGRHESKLDPIELLSTISKEMGELEPSSVYDKWITLESAAIDHNDANSLIHLYDTLPQIWKNDEASGDIAKLFRVLKKHEAQSVIGIGGMMAAYYSGTYLGIKQAVELDALRIAIEKLYCAGEISRWERQVSLTGLLNVLSECAYTPGKHFAQYHKMKDKEDTRFHKSRLLTDRRIIVSERMQESIPRIMKVSTETGKTNRSFQATMEDILEDTSSLEGVDLIYADPPYTAQQYSRFYHIPESFVKYEAPKLQIFRGKVTAGLYPEGRYKSRFSSKRQAPGAFRDLVDLTQKVNSNLLISYSDTESGETGNDRMLSLNQLLDICGDRFRDLTVYQLSHSYRQFNSSRTSVRGRADKEYLVLAKNHVK